MSDAYVDAIDQVQKELASIVAILSDPTGVYLNMLSGSIAKPSEAQICHIYPNLITLAQSDARVGAALREAADKAFNLMVSDGGENPVSKHQRAMAEVVRGYILDHAARICAAIAQMGGWEMTKLTRAEIEALLPYGPIDDPIIMRKAITQLLAQLDAANELVDQKELGDSLAAAYSEGKLVSQVSAQIMVGAALREAARHINTQAVKLCEGMPGPETALTYMAELADEVMALAPTATAALDRAMEQMREDCISAMAREMKQRLSLKDQKVVASMFPMLRALPLHEEP